MKIALLDVIDTVIVSFGLYEYKFILKLLVLSNVRVSLAVDLIRNARYPNLILNPMYCIYILV